MLGFGGDVSDMQHIDRMLTALSTREDYSRHTDEPATALNAANLHTYLENVMYRRRSNLDPLWNVILIAGLDGDDEPYLASVDLLGTTFTSPTLASGFGGHLAQPILRRRVPNEEATRTLSKEDAVQLVKDCMKVLFYRDARSLDKYSIAVVSKGAEDVELKTDEKLENQSWAFADRIRGVRYHSSTKTLLILCSTGRKQHEHFMILGLCIACILVKILLERAQSVTAS